MVDEETVDDDIAVVINRMRSAGRPSRPASRLPDSSFPCRPAYCNGLQAHVRFVDPHAEGVGRFMTEFHLPARTPGWRGALRSLYTPVIAHGGYSLEDKPFCDGFGRLSREAVNDAAFAPVFFKQGEQFRPFVLRLPDFIIEVFPVKASSPCKMDFAGAAVR